MDKKILKTQAYTTAVVFVVLAGLLWGGKALYDANLKERALERHTQLLRTARTQLQEHLLKAVQDAHQLALLDSVRDFVATPSAVNRARMERTLIDTSDVYGRYDQIRFIDLQGHERVRINHAPGASHAVPEEALQDKSGRYYVQEGLNLEVGQVYLSPLDLNVEQGKIETPHKPVLRLVRMIGDGEGGPAGLLVLNYLAGGLLNQYRAHFPAVDRAMLLNSEGYWLLNHRRENEWSWMLGQPGRTLSAWQPRLWERLQAEPTGQLELNDDLFSFTRFDIANFRNGLFHGDYAINRGLINDTYAAEWTMLVQTEKAQWQAGALYLKNWFKAFLAGLFAMAGVLVHFIITSREERRAARAAQRQQLADFKDLYENAPIGYVTVAADGLITNVNRALLDYLGYERDDIVDRLRISDLMDEESRETIHALMGSLASGQQQQHRADLVCRNGERLTVLCSVSSRLSPFSTLMVGRCSVQDISEQARLERSLEDLAYRDALTGLANRRYFDELASNEVKRLQREGNPLTALALDIDHFKAVNDRYGHDAGDEVLKELAKTCQHLLRGTDILARFGGEEFVVLLPNADLAQGHRRAEALRQALAEKPVTLTSGEAIHYTVSIGVATHPRPEQDRLPLLLKNADEALYRAKRSGRNRVCVALPASLPQQGSASANTA
ncbi:sensor domain-containing diguanylate cyclase [Halomonas marinisediminis]|uniref:diguanylate cyclase n=1 Tax=Halomonas marinisediminis TaxID=2546095 RepID=A0ABY2D8L3_9GAMM|nr:diguanylate cyclase [Halomonas marinisediminis]TDB04266.1 sensor domain-containing diguanylate cyclase [Halomonas marinisediminis]